MLQKVVLKVDQPLQVTLFETDEDGKYTNTVDLFDIAPRFVFYSEPRENGSFVPSIRRDFEHSGVPYQILLRPGRIVRNDGLELEQFPGEREQIVEAVVLRLATDRGRLSIHEADERSAADDAVRLTFSMYEIWKELRKFRHSFALDEIKDALTILHTSVVEITKVDKKSKHVLSSSAFPVMALRQRDDDERAYLEFNPMVKNAIKQLRYRHMNYEWMMQIPNPLSRWLYKRLCQTVVGLCDSDRPVVVMTAREISRDSGVAPRSRQRDAFRRVTRAVEALVERGIIEECKPHAFREGRAISDLSYDFVPTPRFLVEIRRSDRLVNDAKRRLRLSSGTDEPDTFIRVGRSISYQARTDRRQLFLTDIVEVEP
jgi:hypothetical protein